MEQSKSQISSRRSKKKNAPRVVFRDVAICGFPVGGLEHIGLHVYVGNGTIDFSKLPWREDYDEHLQKEEILSPAQEAVRGLMVEVLDRTPLDEDREKSILSELAAVTKVLRCNSRRRQMTLALQS